MGFLERAIRNGVRDAVGKAVGNAITKAVEPKATEFVNKTAQHFDNAAQNHNANQSQFTSGFEGAFKNLERATQNYATEMSKNMKICPSCGKGATADKKFCPECGSELPEQTLAEGAVCTKCGKQNAVGTKFCQECGEKLPAAIQEEQAIETRNANVLVEWEVKLPNFPKWDCGGTNFHIEEYDVGCFGFSADFGGNHIAAKEAVIQYRQILLQNGFRQAGQYPNIEHLYKKIDEVCYHVNTEHCFDGDPDCPTIYFDKSEPMGGFDYVKPEPKKQIGLKDIFKF